MSEFDNFIELLKAAPSYVKDNVMCYYYHNTSACRLCTKKDCKAREPRPIAELTRKIPKTRNFSLVLKYRKTMRKILGVTK